MSELPPALRANPELDLWMRVDAAETVTAFTGKVELVQGIVSAFARIVAEELDVAFERVRIATADTAHGLDEGFTAGSMSMRDSGSALRQAAAEVRGVLLARAAAALGVPAPALHVDDGTVADADGARSVTYWQLNGGRPLGVRARGKVAPKHPSRRRVAGATARNRIDLEDIVTGRTRYVHDLSHDRLAHGRVVRPPRPGAALQALDTAPVRRLAGVIEVIRDGSFVGVVAEREDQATRAADILRARARWAGTAALPPRAVGAWLRERPARVFEVVDGVPTVERAPPAAADGWTHTASYSRPYLMHGSIGPSAAMALWEDGRLTVWTHSQGVYFLRDAIAEALGLAPERIRCRHVVGAGCYGHNGADDAALDATLLARAAPGRAVLVKWSRQDEHQWEPYGAPASVELRAALDADDRIVRWRHDAWGTTHSSRPRPPGAPNLLAGVALDTPVHSRPPAPMLIPEAGIHRNATPIYDVGERRIVKHFVEDMPLRTSSLRALGAYANVLAIESFMDELAAARGRSPLAFRLDHLHDPRGRAVLEAAAEGAGWGGEPSSGFGEGTGIGFARYKNQMAYAAIVVRLRVDDATAAIALDRVVIAADCGEVVDPSGAANQLEGGALQSASWTLLEEVSNDGTAVTSVDWDTYPILRFPQVPEVETILVDRPGEPYLGTGEAAQGPMAAAIANAIFDATGLRVRDTPFTPARLHAAALVGEAATAADI